MRYFQMTAAAIGLALLTAIAIELKTPSFSARSEDLQLQGHLKDSPQNCNRHGLWRGLLVSVDLTKPPYIITHHGADRASSVGTHEVIYVTDDGVRLRGLQPVTDVHIPWSSIACVVDVDPWFKDLDEEEIEKRRVN